MTKRATGMSHLRQDPSPRRELLCVGSEDTLTNEIKVFLVPHQGAGSITYKPYTPKSFLEQFSKLKM